MAGFGAGTKTKGRETGGGKMSYKVTSMAESRVCDKAVDVTNSGGGAVQLGGDYAVRFCGFRFFERLPDFLCLFLFLSFAEALATASAGGAAVEVTESWMERLRCCFCLPFCFLLVRARAVAPAGLFFCKTES